MWPEAPNPLPPHADWATAARTIQEAVDAAQPGDTILVTNGLYATGDRAVYGTMTNRVAVDRPVRVQSVNGPEATVIQGYQVPGLTNGDGAVRCVYLTNGAVLSGFTIIHGATRDYGDTTLEKSGGGVWCMSTGAEVTNCTLLDNSASGSGGGAYAGTLNNCALAGNWAVLGGGGGCNGTRNSCRFTQNWAVGPGGGAYNDVLNNCVLTSNRTVGYYANGGGAFKGVMNNCLLTGNSAQSGGAAHTATLNNCTLTANSAQIGGGTYNSTLNNSILYYNTATSNNNYYGGLLNYCCTVPTPTGGTGNLTTEPQLGSASHLGASSPCRGAGHAAYATGLDLDGEPWLAPPSIGCDEYRPGSVSGPLTVAMAVSKTYVGTGFSVDLTAAVSGRVAASAWDFGDGVVLSNRPYASHAWGVPGDYRVVLRAYNESHPEGISATVTVRVAVRPVHYVALASSNPWPPYDSWETAAAILQDALDVAAPGALVLVTNGVYATGGRVVYGTMGNRAAVIQPVTVQSVNGPEVTVIQGYGLPGAYRWGDGAIRCVYLTNGAVLSGFTLTNGATRGGGVWEQERSGGGLWCESTNALATNCLIVGNYAVGGGGGAYSGTLRNCTLTGNTVSWYGGGAYASTLYNSTLTRNSAWVEGGGACVSLLNNCTLTGNSAPSAGGASSATLHNCIVYFNTADSNPNFSGGTLNYCCTTPDPGNGNGNLIEDPQLASTVRLSFDSPCGGAGNPALSTGQDLDGESWFNPPAIGADEYHDSGVSGPLTVAIETSRTNVPPGIAVDLIAAINGRVAESVWDFGDGAREGNQPFTRHRWDTPGEYAVVLWAYNADFPEGRSATVLIRVTAHYVSPTSPNPLPPYTSWDTAAHTIQEAVDATTDPGAVVLVTNGIYATGGRAVYGTMTNRVAVSKPVRVRSVNGPELTFIQGYRVPGTTNGDGAIRCVYLTNGAVLSGFTITGGATRAAGYYPDEESGGGVWCASGTAVVTNCTLRGNSAAAQGGGVYSGTLLNCTLVGNSSSWYGGGAYVATLNNCALAGNVAAQYGGGSLGGTLNNCTLTGNSALVGGGALQGTLNNCIVYYNSASSNANYHDATLNYCCTTPAPATGSGNITADPQLASVTHLSSSSPCRATGSTTYATGLDLDGDAWFVPPAMGCDESEAAPLVGFLTVAIQLPWTNVAAGVPLPLSASISGRVAASAWDFGDGTILSNHPYASHAWSDPGDHPVVLRAYNDDYPSGLTATVTVRVLAHPVHYVSAASTNPIPPYASWATAAATIQDAVDAAPVGGEVLVTNGTYAAGGRAVFGLMTNRVAVDRPVSIRSVNGPEVTVIQGYRLPETTNGDGAIRCVYLADGALLSGFTLTNGATRDLQGDPRRERSGGGVWCESTKATVSNCVLTGNSVGTDGSGGGTFSGTLHNCALTGNLACTGGGAYSAILNNCSLTGNSGFWGGGATAGELNNCTLTRNRAYRGGGISGGALNNCILYYNTATSSNNYCSSILNYCCTIPLPATGNGNLTAEPQLAGVSRLSAASPCRGAGNSASATGVDLDGEPWLNPPSIGCDEYQAGAVTGPLTVSFDITRTSLFAGSVVDLAGWINGRVATSVWDFGDGTILSNRACTSYAWGAPGTYTVVFRAYNESHPEGVSALATVHVRMHYVSIASGNPLPPYTSWETAAHTIQEAVDAATEAGAVILVTNGVYATGGRAVYGLMTNRVAVDRPVTVRSVNGPQVTVIRGYQVPGTINGEGAIRCVYLTNGAALNGFTLTQGATQTGSDPKTLYGGGVWSESTNTVVANCVIAGNAAAHGGGGAFEGTLLNCTIIGNSAGSGGGTYMGTLDHCVLRNNSTTGLGHGGGAAFGTLRNCLLWGNTSSGPGGGAYGGTLNNCTLVGNAAGSGGGGAFGNSTMAPLWLTNCILYYNTAPNGSNRYGANLNHCCTIPAYFPGDDTITNEPLFVDWLNGNFRLQSNSPCLNAGTNVSGLGATDLDGRPRVVGGTVDVGAYEFQAPGFSQFTPWLAQCGLPADGSADYADPDGDGLNNWQEWLCGTDPGNPLSVLRLLPPSQGSSGVVVSWQSVTNRCYFLERSSGLANRPPFLPLATNLPGQSGTTTFTDTNAPTGAPVFYRVGTQP